MKARFKIFWRWWGTTAADYFMLGLIYAGLFRAAEQKDWFDFWLMVAASIFVFICIWLDNRTKTRQPSVGDEVQISGVGPTFVVMGVGKIEGENKVLVCWHQRGEEVDCWISTRFLTKVRGAL